MTFEVAVGLGVALTWAWQAPTATVSLGWRPVPAFELQVSGTAAPIPLGDYSTEGREATRCYCFGELPRPDQLAGLTAGIFPLRANAGDWRVAVGARVGGGLTHDHPGWPDYDQEAAEVYPPAWHPSLDVAAVAEAQDDHLGLRLVVERVQWLRADDYDYSSSPAVLAPRLEGFYRW